MTKAISYDMFSGTLTMTIAFTLIASGVLNLNPYGVCMALTTCSCAAYATPPGAAYAAITAGTGWVSSGTQLKVGLFYDVVVAIMTSTICYNLAVVLL